jgi:hypothetical protein
VGLPPDLAQKGWLQVLRGWQNHGWQNHGDLKRREKLMELSLRR